MKAVVVVAIFIAIGLFWDMNYNHGSLLAAVTTMLRHIRSSFGL